MFITKDSLVFADSVERYIYNYIVENFKIDIENGATRRGIMNLEELISFLYETKYDVHVFCYEAKNKLKRNPLDITVKMLKDYNKKWFMLRAG